MVFSVVIGLSFKDPVVDETDGNGLAGDGGGHPRREVHRRATRERRVDRLEIGIPGFRRNPRTDVSHARRRDDLPVALEGELHRHLRAGPGHVLLRRHPAGTQRVEHGMDGVELPLGIVVLGARGCGRRRWGGALDCQPQVLRQWNAVIGNTGSVAEDAADAGGAGMAAEDAAARGRRYGSGGACHRRHHRSESQCPARPHGASITS